MTNALTIDLSEGQITNMNVRKEGQGDERQVAIDLSISITTGDRVLDCFGNRTEIKNTLFRKDGSPILEQIKPIQFDRVFGACVITVHQGAGLKFDIKTGSEELLTLHVEEIKKCHVLPVDGHRVVLSFVAQLFPSDNQFIGLVKCFKESLGFDCEPRQPELDMEDKPNTVDAESTEVPETPKALGEGTKALTEGPKAIDGEKEPVPDDEPEEPETE